MSIPVFFNLFPLSLFVNTPTMKGLRRVLSRASCFRQDLDEEHGVVFMDTPRQTNGTDKKQPMVNQVEMNHFGESTNPLTPSALDGMADRVRESLDAMSTLLSAIKAPLPTGTGDGSVLPKEEKDTVASTLATVVKDVSHLGYDSVEKLAKMTIKTKAGDVVDDREYLMEELVNVCCTCRGILRRLTRLLGCSKPAQRQGWTETHKRLCDDSLERPATSSTSIHE